MYTDYHSQFWAHALTLKSAADSIHNLSRSIANAKVDLNPHQVDAALFAFRSPLTKGAILADEVGLGKTIEAGIVLAQRWAERRRRILLILPATLRKQWQQEIEEKFFLPTVVLESRNFNQLQRNGHANPFEQKESLVACSYHFASAKANEIRRVPWDMVVVDEAHRLRNVYKPSNKMARTISEAVAHAPKLLLTATPLQNSLMELYGLVSIIDPHVFGDPASFREKFVRANDEEHRNTLLRERLKPLCTRTLRKQVLEYVRFTNRVPITQEFLPSDEEHQLYQEVSAYLQRDVLLALPSSQRMLMTMILRKLLASSSFAIGGTLRKLVTRLEELLVEQEPPQTVDLEDDFENLEELEDEWEEETTEEPEIDPAMIREELAELNRYADLADGIRDNAKGKALLSALKIAFDKAESLGARRKAVIFTESRRTQDYLFYLLSSSGYQGKLVLMNGTNTDEHSRNIYKQWLQRHEGESVISGSRTVDTKAAIVEEFRDRATLMIATEAGAEGINLQFASLVVNYDLPWNPQRIEQRIGRCHRYGQQHDVVVVNFLNRRNEADLRVFQLLSEKFQLFDGVFGASDEVLGALESGVDIERRISQVYQECRSTDEIQTAFDSLQLELEEQVQSRMAQTREALLDNFDEDVHSRLKVHRKQAFSSLSNRERWLLSLTQHELTNEATFDPKKPRFFYTGSDARKGNYNLDWKLAEKHHDTFYRADHPLAAMLIERATKRELGLAEIVFDYDAHGTRIAALEQFRGSTGWLELSKLTVQSFDSEEFLVFAAENDGGERLDGELCQKLLSLPASIANKSCAKPAGGYLDEARKEATEQCVQQVDNRNGVFFDEEVGKLERWSDDLKLGLERELKELDQQIKEIRRDSQAATALTEKLTAQKRLKHAESERNIKRRQLYDAQDAIDTQREELIARIEGQLTMEHTSKTCFTIRWSLA
ncbi:SNF2-related protein [Botrimarina mediterranea]|uniref:SNF2-related protein n=1 Tax=Botrimarina mediterranea TaxID=2528022 RepID=UPI001188775F|nr:RNA polymerase-associated protein RapA [Planctomycetes bacterium K2D]